MRTRKYFDKPLIEERIKNFVVSLPHRFIGLLLDIGILHYSDDLTKLILRPRKKWKCGTCGKKYHSISQRVTYDGDGKSIHIPIYLCCDFSCDRCFENKKTCYYKDTRTKGFCEGFHLYSGEEELKEMV